MLIVDSLDKLPFPAGADAALTFGCFDGFHVGHRRIAQRLNEAGKTFGALRGLLTFDPHPAQVFQGVSGPFLIDTRREKEEILMGQPLDFAVFFKFTADFAAVSAERFVREYLAGRFRLRKMVVGPDTRFGSRSEGTVELLEAEGKKLGFEVEVVEKERVGDEPVSSTRVRELVAAGEVERAEEFLGRPFRMTGEVVTGDGRSRSNGFPPTANLEVEAGKLLPLDGVYAVKVLTSLAPSSRMEPKSAGSMAEHGASEASHYAAGCGDPAIQGSSHYAVRDGRTAHVGALQNAEHNGVANVGFRPTVGGTRRVVEAHIFGFSGDLYGERIALDFKRFIRREERFSSLDELKKQIDKDIEVAEKIFRV